MRNRPHSAARFLAGLAAAGVIALSAHAAPAAGTSGPVFDQILRSLNSDAFAERQAASAALVAPDSGVTVRRIEDALADPALSPEQRARLVAAAGELFVREPRPAMGVSFGSVIDVRSGRGVTVAGTIENFESARALRAGDVILAINDAPVHDYDSGNSAIRNQIMSYDPGDELRLSIVRGGEPMTVSLRLGRYSDLPGPNFRDAAPGRPSNDTVQAAWRNRQERLESLVSGAPARDCSLRPAGWREADEASLNAMRDSAREMEHAARAAGVNPEQVDVNTIVPSLTVAGEGRQWPALNESEFASALQRSAGLWPGAALRDRGNQGGFGPPDNPQVRLRNQARANELRNIYTIMAEQHRQLTAEIARRDLPVEQREQLVQLREALRTNAIMVRDQLAQMNVAVAPLE